MRPVSFKSHARLGVLLAVLVTQALSACGFTSDAASETPAIRPPATTPAAPTVPTLAPVATQKAEVAVVSIPEPPCEPIKLPGSLFAAGRAELPAVVPDLDKFAAEVNAVAQLGTRIAIRIEGHTDSDPSSFPGGNQGLSEARAGAARDYLVNQGLDPAWIVSVEGKADTVPVATNDTLEGKALNRRVVVSLEC